MHLLRPQLTQSLLDTLKKQSVNVHGPHGQGQERLLEDLNRLAQEDGFIVFKLDMKRWSDDYEGMIGEISRQLHRQLPEAGQINDLGQFASALDAHAANTSVLLMLNRFDALLDNTAHLDPKFEQFFRHLNSLRNQQYRVLLAITDKTYNQYRFYVDKIHNTSPLDLKLRELRPLVYQDIKTELQHRLNHMKQNDLAKLACAIHSHKQAFEFMEYCIDQINDDNDKGLRLEIQLTEWARNFNRNHKRTFRRQLDALLNWFGIADKEIAQLSLKLKMLLVSVAGLLTLLTIFFDKIKQLFGLSK